VPPSPEHKCFFYKLLTRPFAINLFSFSENELKLTYGNVEFQTFQRVEGRHEIHRVI
jgi:hypothetical protein